MDEKLDKLYKLVIVALILIGVLFIIVIANMFKGDSTNNNNNTPAENSTYDISSFNTLDLKGVLDLFDTKKTYVVFFGRPTCSACVKFLPTLKKMQEKYQFITQNLDITGVDAQSSDFEKLMKKLSKKVTLTVNGEKTTKEFGDFYGYTPMVFIIKDGKFVDGFVGAYSESNYEKFLNNNGIKK